MVKIKVKYVEPAGYIPEELRKEYGLGEYANKTFDNEKKASETGEDCGDLKAYRSDNAPKNKDER